MRLEWSERTDSAPTTEKSFMMKSRRQSGRALLLLLLLLLAYCQQAVAATKVARRFSDDESGRPRHRRLAYGKVMKQVRSMVNSLVSGDLPPEEFKAKYTGHEFGALTAEAYGNAVAEGLRRHHDQLAELPEERINLLRETLPLFKKGSGAHRRASTTYAQGTNRYTRPQYELWIRDNLDTGDELRVQADKEWVRQNRGRYRLGSEKRTRLPDQETPQERDLEDALSKVAPTRHQADEGEGRGLPKKPLKRSQKGIGHVASPEPGREPKEGSPEGAEIPHKPRDVHLMGPPPSLTREEKERRRRRRKSVRFSLERSADTEESRADDEAGATEGVPERPFQILEDLRQRCNEMVDSFHDASSEREQTMAAIRGLKAKGNLLLESFSELFMQIKTLESIVKPAQRMTAQDRGRILREIELVQAQLKELEDELHEYGLSIERLQSADAMDQLASRAMALARERDTIFQQVMRKEGSHKYLKGISPDMEQARRTLGQVIEAQRVRDSLQSGLSEKQDNLLLLERIVSERIARLHQDVVPSPLDTTKENSTERELKETIFHPTHQDSTRAQGLHDVSVLLERLSQERSPSQKPAREALDGDDNNDDDQGTSSGYLTAEEFGEQATTWTTLLYAIENELDHVTRALRVAKVEGEELKDEYTRFLAHGWHSELLGSLPPRMDPAQHESLLLEKWKLMQSQFRESAEHRASYEGVAMAALKLAQGEGLNPHLDRTISHWISSVQQHLQRLPEHHSHEELLESLERIGKQRERIAQLWAERLKLLDDVRSLWDSLKMVGGQANELFERLLEKANSLPLQQQQQQQPQQQQEEQHPTEEPDSLESLNKGNVPPPSDATLESQMLEYGTRQAGSGEMVEPEEILFVREEEETAHPLGMPQLGSVIAKKGLEDQPREIVPDEQRAREMEVPEVNRVRRNIDELVGALLHLNNQSIEVESTLKEAKTECLALKDTLILLDQRVINSRHQLLIVQKMRDDPQEYAGIANEVSVMMNQMWVIKRQLKALEQTLEKLPSAFSTTKTASTLSPELNATLQAVVKPTFLEELSSSQDRTNLETKVQEAQQLWDHLEQAPESYELLYTELLSLRDELRSLVSQVSKNIEQAQALIFDMGSQQAREDEALAKVESPKAHTHTTVATSNLSDLDASNDEQAKGNLDDMNKKGPLKRSMTEEGEVRHRSRESYQKNQTDIESYQEEGEEFPPFLERTVHQDQTKEMMADKVIMEETFPRSDTSELREENPEVDDSEKGDQEELDRNDTVSGREETFGKGSSTATTTAISPQEGFGASEGDSEVEDTHDSETAPLEQVPSTQEPKQLVSVQEEDILRSSSEEEATNLNAAEQVTDVWNEVQDHRHASVQEERDQSDHEEIVKRAIDVGEGLVPDPGIQRAEDRQPQDTVDSSYEDYPAEEETHFSEQKEEILETLDASLSQEELEPEFESEPAAESKFKVNFEGAITSGERSPSSIQGEKEEEREEEEDKALVISGPSHENKEAEDERGHKNDLPDINISELEPEEVNRNLQELESDEDRLETEIEPQFKFESEDEKETDKEKIQETDQTESGSQEEHVSYNEIPDEEQPLRIIPEPVPLPVSEETSNDGRKHARTQDLVPHNHHSRKIKQGLFSETDKLLTGAHEEEAMTLGRDPLTRSKSQVKGKSKSKNKTKAKSKGKRKVRGRQLKRRHKLVPRPLRSWKKVTKKPLGDDSSKVTGGAGGNQVEILKSIKGKKAATSTKVSSPSMAPPSSPRSNSFKGKTTTKSYSPPSPVITPSHSTGSSGGASERSYNPNASVENKSSSSSTGHTPVRSERRISTSERKEAKIPTRETAIVKNMMPLSKSAGKRIFAELSSEEKKQISIIDPRKLTLAEFRQLSDRIAAGLPPGYIHKLQFKPEMEAGDIARLNKLAFAEFTADDLRQLKDLHMLHRSHWKHLGENVAEGPFHPGRAITEDSLRFIPLNVCSGTLVGQIPMTSFRRLTELQLQQLELSHFDKYQMSAIPLLALRGISKEKAKQVGSSIKKTSRLHPRYGMTLSRWSSLSRPAREELYKSWYSSSAYELGQAWFGLGTMGWVVRPFIFIW